MRASQSDAPTEVKSGLRNLKEDKEAGRLSNVMASLGLLCILTMTPGCVSRSAYRELEEDLRKEREEKMVLSNELNSRKMKRIEALEVQISACNQQIVAAKAAGEIIAKKAEEAGYYRGAAEFNRSLQVIGAPSSSGSWIFADHYYTFQVRLAGQPLYSMTVETDEEMPPVIQGLALLSELSELMPYRPKM